MVMVMLNDGDHDCELVMYGCDMKQEISRWGGGREDEVLRQ